jgi:hypothetical protein
MADITFRYNRAPTGELSGESLVSQTEQALSEISGESSHAEEEAARAVQIATAAETKADQAVQTVGQAQTTANSALATAQSTQSSATQAVQTAQSAVTTSQGAVQTAQNAVSTAQSAQTAAQNAVTAAQAASSNAADAASAAEGSATSASAAQTAAQSAQTSASQSATISTQAQSAAAQSAQSAASAEQSAQLLANPNRYSAKTTSLTLSAGQTIDIADLDNSNVAVGNKVVDAVGNIFQIASIDTENNQVTLVDGDTSATPPILGYWANPAFPVPNSAAAHNCFFRGADLSLKYTIAELSAKVQAGDFSDIYIGDYYPMSVTIDGTAYSLTCRVADLDYFVHNGNTETTAHHIVFVPDEAFMTSQMNDTNTTAGGFAGSKAWTTIIPMITTGLQNAFGSSHVLRHSRLLTKTVNSSTPSMAGAGYTGAATDFAWYDAYACYLTEVMVYGCTVFSSSYLDVADGNHQFALFRLAKEYVSKPRANWWLSAVANAISFANVANNGNAIAAGASANLSVRPYFLFA